MKCSPSTEKNRTPLKIIIAFLFFLLTVGISHPVKAAITDMPYSEECGYFFDSEESAAQFVHYLCQYTTPKKTRITCPKSTELDKYVPYIWWTNFCAIVNKPNELVREITHSGKEYKTVDLTFSRLKEKDAIALEKSKEILDRLDLYDKSEYEKIKGVYDWIDHNVSYAMEVLIHPNEDWNVNASAYGALVDRRTVCEGYSEAFEMMLRQLGVHVERVSGRAKGYDILHAYDAVELEGKMYYADSCFGGKSNFLRSQVGIEETGHIIEGSTLISNLSEEDYDVTKADNSVRVSEIKLDKTNISLNEGEFETVSATIYPENAATKRHYFTSSNPDVANVSYETGVIAAISPGTAEIVVHSTDGNKQSVCKVTVSPTKYPLDEIQLYKDSLNVYIGRPQKVEYELCPLFTTQRNLIWTSDDETIAIVDENGIVSGVMPGSTTIRVTEGNISSQIPVNIYQKPESVAFDEDEITMEVFTNRQLMPIFAPETTTEKEIHWTVSTDNKIPVVRVDQDGNVYASAPGEATITARSRSVYDVVTECKITVTTEIPVRGLSLSSSSLTVENGETLSVFPVFTPENPTDKDIIWTSDDSSIATVSGGRVTGKTEGKTIIRAESVDGWFEATCEVEIIPENSIKKAKISYVETWDYTGKQITPNVTVRNRDYSKTLKENRDYQISYGENINSGNGTITITGIGDYYGEETQTFTIQPRDIDKTNYVSKSAVNYTGEVIYPDMEWSYNGANLIEGIDYTVTCESVNAGDAKMTVTGTGNFTGEHEYTYKILPIDISEGTLSAEDITYSKSPQTIIVNGLYGEVVLQEGIDFTVKQPTSAQKTGKQRVYVAGINNFRNGLYVSYQVLPKDISECDVNEVKDITYDGQTHVSAVKVYDNGVVLDSYQEYSVTQDIAQDVGTYGVTIEGKGSYTGSVSRSYKIIPATLTIDMVSEVGSQKYTGNPITPEISVTYNQTTLENGKDYSVSYQNNTEAGTATATITGNGNYQGKISVPFNIVKEQETIVQCTSHTYGNWDEVKQSTCMEAGYMKKHCINCGAEYVRTLPIKSHTWDIDYTIDKEATCTATGAKSIHCSVCGTIKSGSTTIIEKTPHEYGEWTVLKDASCTEAGVKKAICTICSDEKTVGIEAHGHVWGEDYTIKKEATCTEDGLEAILCSVCGTEKEGSEIIIPKTGHNFSKWNILSEASCTENGVKERVCKTCNVKETETTQALGHNYSSWKADNEETHTRVCQYDDSHNETEAHIWDEGIITKPLTTTEAGEKKYTCSTCGYEKTENLYHDASGIAELVKSIPKNISESDEEFVTRIYTIIEELPEDERAKIPTEVLNMLKSAKDSIEKIKEDKNAEERQKQEDEMAKERVAFAINNIPDTVSLDDEAVIVLARNQYNALTDTQRDMLSASDKEKLKRAEDRITELKRGANQKDAPDNSGATNTTPPTQNTNTTNKTTPTNPTNTSGKVGVTTTNNSVLKSASDEGPSGTVFNVLCLKQKSAATKSITITWNRVPGAKYIVYGSKCGQKFVKLRETSANKYTQKGLKKGTYYKYLVVAVKGDSVVSISKTVHIATKGGKNGNVKKLSLSKKSVTLKPKKTYTLKTKQTADKTPKKHRKIIYESSNSKVATVSSKGKIKAVGRGTAYIYAYAQNGVYAKVKVKVK